MKKYHLAHHYKNFELGFGVTSTFLLFDGLQLIDGAERLHLFIGKIWDYLFNTVLPV